MAHERPELTNFKTQRVVSQPNSSQEALRRTERQFSLSTESKDHSLATSPSQTAKPRRKLPPTPTPMTVVKKSDSVRTSRKLPQVPHVSSWRDKPASEHVHRKMSRPAARPSKLATPSQDDSSESNSSRRSSFGGRMDHNNSAMSTDNVNVNTPTNGKSH